MTSAVVGVDACKAGWVAFWFQDQRAMASVYADINSLLQAHPQDTVLVDIPIGLMPQARQLEQRLRPKLGKRSSSLFAIPCREAVYAGSYVDACDINQQQTGKRFAIQTWHICPKIREMDAVLQQLPGERHRVIECHPELAFAGLAGATLRHSKRCSDGEQERLAILKPFIPGIADEVARCRKIYRKNQLATDDLLDAAALAATGVCGFELASEGEVDATGLPVQMALPLRPLPS